MKKLLTTLALFGGLILGSLAFAPTASAAECPDDPSGQCPVPAPCGTPDTAPCSPPCNPATTPDGCPDPNGKVTAPTPDPNAAALWVRVVTAEQTANDYRQQVVALTAKVERVQRIADRRAATIQRLRAKIRALR